MFRTILLVLLITLAASLRCQVLPDPTWRLEDIYPSREAWNQEYRECMEAIGAEDTVQVRQVRSSVDRLLKYAQLLTDADMRDREAAEMAGQAGRLREKADQILPGTGRPTEGDGNLMDVSCRDESAGPSPGVIIRMLNYQSIPREAYMVPDSSVLLLDYQLMATLRKSPDALERDRAMQTFWRHQRQYEDTLAGLLHVITEQHVTAARRAGKQNSLRAVLDPDSIPEEVYLTLIRTVKENLAPMHRYLRLKQKILGLDTFRYADIYASVTSEIHQDIPYRQAAGILTNALHVMGPEYSRGLDSAFTNRWIDVYPRAGKFPGAWSTGIYGVHPYVLMNYTGTYEDLTILSHELGHAMHFWFASRNQSFEHSEPSPFLSEVPSMLNEILLLQRILEQETIDRMKLFLLDSYLERIRNGIYRQTLLAEFDLLKHTRVEAGYILTASWLDSSYLALTREYYGHEEGITQVDEYIRCEWTMVPDPDLNFAVYQYPVGIAACITLADRILQKQDTAGYLNFLKAGSSKLPGTLLREAGIDLADPGSYLSAIGMFDALVERMEVLYETGRY